VATYGFLGAAIPETPHRKSEARMGDRTAVTLPRPDADTFPATWPAHGRASWNSFAPPRFGREIQHANGEGLYRLDSSVHFLSRKRHPETMGEAEIGAYLSHLASDAKVGAST
jgi:hypothetical protein